MSAPHSCIADEIESLANSLRSRGYAPATITMYRWHLTTFDSFLKAIGVEDLRGVTREHVEAFHASFRKRKLSSSTQAQAVQAVGRMFGDLIDRGLLLVDPTAGVKRLRRRQQLPRHVPSRTVVSRLLGAANTSLRTGVRDRAILETLYGSALRIGELCALTVHDVDLDNRLIRITRGKGNKGRVVPMGDACRSWLREYLDKVRPWWAKRGPQERALFLTNRAEQINRNAVRQAIFNLCEQAGIKRISPHALRHAAATHMIAAGANIVHVQKLLGHAHLSATQIYTRVAPMEIKATHRQTHPREVQP